jgi:hypothetical protein
MFIEEVSELGHGEALCALWIWRSREAIAKPRFSRTRMDVSALRVPLRVRRIASVETIASSEKTAKTTKISIRENPFFIIIVQDKFLNAELAVE